MRIPLVSWFRDKRFFISGGIVMPVINMKATGVKNKDLIVCLN